MGAGDTGGSVTRWLDDLKGGEQAAAQPLWARYFDRLVRLARAHLRSAGRRGAEADEEDIALSAFDAFCRGAAAGRFPQLADRDGLWRLLVTMTAGKAVDRARRRARQRRGGGRVLGQADLAGSGPEGIGGGIEGVVGDEPTPEFAAMVAEEYRRLIEALGDETLRRVAIWRMEGYTVDEIAARLGCARRTVAYRLELIRSIWQGEPK
jgi:DNA-directed RNA polymerase specialized sigma24 family protein